MKLTTVNLVVFLFYYKASLGLTSKFTTTPQPREFVECGSDIQLDWIFDTTDLQLDSITWYKIGAHDSRIATFSSGAFGLNTAADYPPAQEDRIEYVSGVGSATIKLLQAKSLDSIILRVDVLYGNLQKIKSQTTLSVVVAPVSIAPILSSNTTVLLDTPTHDLQCTFSSWPKPEVHWYHLSEKIVEDNIKYFITADKTENPDGCIDTSITSTLTIKNIELSDTGELRCETEIATNVVVKETQTTYMQVQVKPGQIYPTNMSITPSNIIGGQSAVLLCQAYSIPPSTYEIVVNNGVVSRGSGDSDGLFTYTISSAHAYHDGVYTCRAINAIGVDEVNIVLNVSVVPEILLANSAALDFSISSALSIDCNIKGDPLTAEDVTWKKIAGDEVTTFSQTRSVSFSNSTITHVKNTITIASVATSDSGVYRCQANNFIGTVSENVTVYITYLDNVVSNLVADVAFEQNKEFKFQCNISGYPQPSISWFSNDEQITNTSVIGVDESFSGFVWHIASELRLVLDMQRFGQIKCKAANDLGEEASTSRDVKFPYVPFVTLTGSPRIVTINNTQAVSTDSNQKTTFTCVVTGYEHVKISWWRNGVNHTNFAAFESVVLSNEFGYKQTSTLELDITLEENFQYYKCVGETSVGSREQIVQVYVLDGSVTNPLGGQISFEWGRTATLDWEYKYSQPVLSITWTKQKNERTDEFVVGTLSNTAENVLSANMKSDKYTYNATSISGLVISNLTLDDEGVYSILITFQNSPRVMKANVYLSVSVSPFNTSISPVDDVVVPEGSPFSLTCSSVAKPLPNIAWFTDQEISNSESRFMILVSSEPVPENQTKVTSVLTTNAAILSDDTQFRCVVKGLFNNDVANKSITVLYAPKNTTIFASINPVALGSPVILTCLTYANPANVAYQWYLNERFLNNSTHNNLTIAASAMADEGKYTCIPKNSVGVESNFSLFLFVNVPPKLIDNNSPVVVNSGEKAIMWCAYYGDPPMDVRWLFPQGVAGNTQIETIHSNTSYVLKNTSFTIGTSAITDSGVFMCHANNSFFNASANITFKVKYPVSITSHSLTLPQDNQLLGTKVTKHCVATAAPKIDAISWMLDGEQITDHNATEEIVEEGFYYDKRKSVLVHEMISQQDAGRLSCVAVNSEGKANESTLLNVQFAPLLNITASLKIMEHESANFTCTATAQPSPNIAWRFNNNELTSGSKISIVSNTVYASHSSTNTSTIRITEATRNDYWGTFSCQAENIIDKITGSSILDVQYPPDQVAPHSIVYGNQNKTLTLNCFVKANPVATYTWYVNEVEKNVNTAHYTVQDAYFSDEGNYTCVPRNAFGSPGSRSFIVAMKVKPVIYNVTCTSDKPTFGDKTVVCTCQGYGVPTPKFYWTKNLQEVILAKTSTLTQMVPYDNDDVYVCHLSNQAGAVNSKKPTAEELSDDEDFSYILYLLIPLLAFLILLLAWCLCKGNSKAGEEGVLVPVNRSVALPPPSFINTVTPVYEEKEFESIEVNLMFNNDVSRPTSVVSDIDAMKCLSPSVADGNVYEELPYDLRSVETLEY